MKKIIASVCALILGLSFCACANPNNTDNNAVDYGTLADADIWGAPATEKILQDVHGIYDEIRTDATVDVTAARGEYESQHIIITAKEKPLQYTLSIGEMKSADGTLFPADNVEVFHEKYVHVIKNYDKTGTPTGYYPDALVPYENIVKVGENVVNANENQGLYFRFNVPITQKADTYTGKATLNIGGDRMEIPLTLTVADLTVSEESHAKNNFFSRGLFHKGELESTQRMFDLYTEALFEYRLSPCTIMMESYHSDEEIESYVDKCYEYMQNPKCTNIAIPYGTKNIGGYTCIDPEIFEKYLKAYAKRSFEENYNMLKKLVCYLGIIDEPQLNGTFDALKVVVGVYRDTLSSVAEEIENDTSITSPIKAEVVASMRKVRNTITTHYNQEFAEYIDTWCPMYHMYDGELIHNYDSQEERWWYGCISPRAPYPTYHIEDTLLSARAVSWMQAEYGITGNLYWGYDLYANYNGKYYEEIEDYYGGDAERYDQVNGDGYLFYPGKKYGIDGPVGSLRLEAIRDGLEEYELLYAMMNTYDEISEKVSAVAPDKAFTSDKVVKSMTTQIYSGTQVATTSAIFQSARETLFKLAKITSDVEMCILDFSDDNRGTITYKILAPSDASIKRGNTTLQSNDTAGDYNVYVIETQLTQAKNSLDLTIEKGGQTYTYTQPFGGKVTINLASACVDTEFTEEEVIPTMTLVDSSSVNSVLSGQIAKVDLPTTIVEETEENLNQAFRVSGNLIKGIGENTSKFIMRVYYEGTDSPNFIISAKHQKAMMYYDLVSVTLKQGMNEIVVPLGAKNWSSLGGIEYLAMYVGNKEGEPARTLYFVETVVYDK